MKTNKKASQLLAWSLAGCALFISHSNFCAAEALGQSDIGHEFDLIKAAEAGNEKKVRQLLDAGADPNQENSRGLTPLRMAVGGGYGPIVERLLEAGADPNKVDIRGETPLERAFGRWHHSIVKQLLKASPHVLKAGLHGVIPLERTFVFGKYEPIIERLLEAGADPNQAGRDFTPLLFAVRRGNGPIIERLLKAGVDPNQTDRAGSTPLSEAADAGNGPIIERLLKAGADPNGADKSTDMTFDRTPLHNAARRGYGPIVNRLLKAGADPNKADRYGLTPLETAALEGHEDVVKLLLRSGARPEGMPEKRRKQEYAKIVKEREQAIQGSLDTQADQQTGYATGGHGFPTALRDLVQEFEGSKEAKAQ